MSVSHTPKPWSKVFLNGHWHIVGVYGRIEIAKVSAYKNRERSKVNSDLIVAAPDLLDALEAIQARINGEFDHPALVAYGPLHETQDIIRICAKVLAKVKGKM